MIRAILLAALSLWFASSSEGRCTTDPVIDAAWSALPEEFRFPCDQHHIVMIDFDEFLTTHPDSWTSDQTKQRAHQAYAFVVGNQWPIYINGAHHRQLVSEFNGPALRYALAAVLAHERIHALGESRESIALLCELKLDMAFADAGYLPPDFHLDTLREQYNAARSEEALALVQGRRP